VRILNQDLNFFTTVSLAMLYYDIGEDAVKKNCYLRARASTATSKGRAVVPFLGMAGLA
jgi:hypothetical protein